MTKTYTVYTERERRTRQDGFLMAMAIEIGGVIAVITAANKWP